MRRRIPIQDEFTYEVEYPVEQRVIAEEVSGTIVTSLVDFDSTQLDLGTAELYDLTEMLKAGVKPGAAVPHEGQVIDNVEMANSIVDEFINLNNQE